MKGESLLCFEERFVGPHSEVRYVIKHHSSFFKKTFFLGSLYMCVCVWGVDIYVWMNFILKTNIV